MHSNDRKKLAPRIAAVLATAHRGKPKSYRGLTAYQILDALPKSVRETLIRNFGKPGKDAGQHYTAASVIAETIRYELGLKRSYVDSRGSYYKVGRKSVRPGYPVTAVYSL